ncbi:MULTISPECIES: hypothetical protein [Bradyrhizobium]|uniref:Uncharacterized protein n=2 Tax=Bradyrhizobium vignae TaxID=1549949 RepID=A0A2U3Q0P1_9BRAD|nr:hypothetical protein [Bradyrhizobium vignae]SPP94918.1 conserved protein of unknown function [Bradyrhizobium vignae]
MLANSRLSCLAAWIRLAHMRTHHTIGGSELLLGVIALRLAVLVLVGWSLTLLPRQTRDSEPACFPGPATRLEAQSLVKTPGSHVANAAFDDMRLHD